jgi:hypothetical protein
MFSAEEVRAIKALWRSGEDVAAPVRLDPLPAAPTNELARGIGGDAQPGGDQRVRKS